MKVKICGITNLKDALAAVEAGSDALGFVFYKKSPRYIAPKKAREIIKNLPENLKKVGVFVNAGEKTIKEIAGLCGLDMLQFHGDETPGFCSLFKNYKIIKAFRIKNKIDLSKILKYNVFAYLFDTYIKSRYGATGKSFNWGLLRCLKSIDRPVFLSGGLNAGNVKKAIKSIQPEWLDVSSSVEVMPGVKDPKKVKEFIKKAKIC